MATIETKQNGDMAMFSNDKKQLRGEKLVARLLTPQETEMVAGGDFTTYAQTGNGYCKFDQKSGGYDQQCPSKPGRVDS